MNKLVVSLACLIILILTSACGEEKRLTGLVIRTVKIEDDVPEVVVTALASEFAARGAMFSKTEGEVIRGKATLELTRDALLNEEQPVMLTLNVRSDSDNFAALARVEADAFPTFRTRNVEYLASEASKVIADRFAEQLRRPEPTWTPREEKKPERSKIG